VASVSGGPRLLCAPTRRVQKRRCLTRTTTTTTLTTTTTTTITTAASSPPPHGPVRPASLDSRFFGACPALPCPALVLALLPDRGTRFYLGPFCSSPGACYQRPALAVSNMFQLPSHQLMSRHPYRPWWGPPPISPLFPSHPSMRLTTSDSYSLPRSARCIQSTMPSRPESPPRVAAQSRRPLPLSF
jgi:hypothetical protein